MHPASSEDVEDENNMANSQEGVSSLGIKNLNSCDSREGSHKQIIKAPRRNTIHDQIGEITFKDSPKKNSLNNSFEVQNSSARKGNFILDSVSNQNYYVKEGDENEEISGYELKVTRNATEDFFEAKAATVTVDEEYDLQ